ncbi:MAG: pyridoxamine 5'-phosphate oxidase family protein [Burkholderiales bacterium]
MPIEYSQTVRQLQDKFATRAMADRIAEFAAPVIIPENKAMIEAMDMFFLATADAQGRPQVSYKGGDPGFVKVMDDTTLAFPIYDGNGLWLSAGNMTANANVGLLFIDFMNPYRVRVNGTASIKDNDQLMNQYPGAIMVVRIAVREIFSNCPRYVHKMQLVKRSKFVPKTGVDTPNPVWKYLNAVQDVLPEKDAKSVASSIQSGKEKMRELDMTKTIREQIAEPD